ncbi:hypothetical protein HQ520_15500 [bacterium]|nr:hypothetical protein [bacterium]
MDRTAAPSCLFVSHSRQSRQVTVRPALLLLLLTAFLYSLTLGGHLYSPDEEILFRTTEALATRGSLAIEPLAGFATRPPADPRADGREFAQYGIGQPLLAVPFYWAGGLVYHLANDATWLNLSRAMPADFPLPDPTVPDSVLARETARRFTLSTFNLFVTSLSAMVLFLLARRLTGSGGPAWIAALLWGGGSMAWPHARTFFTEPLAGLCILLALYPLARNFLPRAGEQPGRAPILLVGIAAGYASLVRIDTIVFLPGLAFIAAWGDFVAQSPLAVRPWKESLLWLKRPSTLIRLALFALPIAASGAIILSLNVLHYGSPLASGYSDQPEGIAFATPILAGLYGFLFSIGKGLFFFSPPLILCLWGLGPMVRRRPVFGWGIVILAVSFLIFQSKWRNWAGGWCWGPRHIMQMHALLAVPIAFWLAGGWTATRRVAVIVLLTMGAAVQVYGCSQNFIAFYRLYYQNPKPPTATPLYDVQAEVPVLARQYALYRRDPQTGRPVGEIPLTRLPAPINDSIYIVQNSQWTRYAQMWRIGLHDFFWLHAIKGPEEQVEN